MKKEQTADDTLLEGLLFATCWLSPMLKPFLWQKIGCMKLNFQLWVEQSKTDDSLAETHFFLLNGLIFHDTDDDFYTWEADIVIRSQWVAWILYFAYKSCVRFCASREWFKKDGIMAKKAWIFFLVHTCLWSLRGSVRPHLDHCCSRYGMMVSTYAEDIICTISLSNVFQPSAGVCRLVCSCLVFPVSYAASKSSWKFVT